MYRRPIHIPRPLFECRKYLMLLFCLKTVSIECWSYSMVIPALEPSTQCAFVSLSGLFLKQFQLVSLLTFSRLARVPRFHPGDFVAKSDPFMSSKYWDKIKLHVRLFTSLAYMAIAYFNYFLDEVHHLGRVIKSASDGSHAIDNWFDTKFQYQHTTSIFVFSFPPKMTTS
jgi:hypothetical protein